MNKQINQNVRIKHVGAWQKQEKKVANKKLLSINNKLNGRIEENANG